MTTSIAPAEAKTLLEFLMDLLTDHDARDAFQQDPEKALHDAGLGNISLEEIKELLPLVLDRCDPHKSADYEEECHHYEGPCPPAHCPPHLSHCDDRPSHDHDVEMAKVVTHLNYVCNNYSFDSHDTIFNNHTSIANLGDGDVDFNQSIDYKPVSADHGGTAVGGDNNAPITHGDGNVVGDGNQVSGQNSHTAFGGGSVYDHVGTGDGGAINFGSGSATSSDADTTVNGHGNTVGQGATSVHGENNNVGSGAQANTQANTDVEIRDSGNDNSHTHTDSHNHTDDSTHLDTSHSGNTDNSHQDNSGLHLPIL